MENNFSAKLGTIAVLSVGLLIPLFLIHSTISARQQRQTEVKANIAQASAGEQKLTGPVLAVVYKERIEQQGKAQVVEKRVVVPPRQLRVKGGATVDTVYRGLYSARVFHSSLQLEGNILLPPRLGLPADRNILEARAYLVMGVTDLRGVDNEPVFSSGGLQRRFNTGAKEALSGPGVHADLGQVDLSRETPYDFSFPLQLTGTERLAIAPAGEETQVKLSSNWPHPSFQGSFLPRTRNVAQDGFEAEWRTTHLGRNFQDLLKNSGSPSQGDTMQVQFMDPVNIYLQSERAVKYGLLFVALTFAGFFLCEVLRNLTIHPFQYLLVGLALAVFFLLLIALSEHLAFGIAYAISAFACTALIGGYVAGVLNNRLGGAGFAAGVATLYGVLYVVLQSEDHALLMGAVLIFLALGTVMLATRRMDWNRFGGGALAKP